MEQANKSLASIGILAATIVSTATLFTLFQLSWGLWGLAATELGLLVIALVGGRVISPQLSTVFPFRRFSFRTLRGSLALYLGTMYMGSTVTLVLAYFIPAMLANSEQMSDLFTSLGLPLAILFVAIMPGFCEEMLHRGAIFAGLNRIDRTWVKVLVVGLIFGLFHLDVFRFATLTIIGMGLTYIMVKTNNIWLPMIFHTLNNLISLGSTYLVLYSPMYEAVTYVDLPQLISGVITNLAWGSMFLFFGIRNLSGRSTDKTGRGKRALLVVGTIVVAYLASYFRLQYQ